MIGAHATPVTGTPTSNSNSRLRPGSIVLFKLSRQPYAANAASWSRLWRPEIDYLELFLDEMEILLSPVSSSAFEIRRPRCRLQCEAFG
jgi:hypothetical protein